MNKKLKYERGELFSKEAMNKFAKYMHEVGEILRNSYFKVIEYKD